MVTPNSAIGSGDLAVSLLSGEVDEYTPSGTFVQKLMDGTNGLGLPTGSAFDGGGNLYVTDFNNNQILKRDAATGAVSLFATNSTLGNGHTFNSPESIVFNRGYSQLLVSDANRGGPGGGINVLSTATGSGVDFYPLPSSSGSEGTGESDWLAFDANSTLFMTNENLTQGVMKVDPATKDVVLPSFAPNLPNTPYGLSFDKSGNLWVAATDQIMEFAPSGSLTHTISGFTQVFAAVFNPGGDRFYAGDLTTGAVYTYDLNGNLHGTFSAGSGVAGLSVLGAAVPPNGTARYAALGDSVPYGHGLANPTKGPKDGLPANQPPSTLAWPQLVHDGLSGLRPLVNRQTGCTLQGPGPAQFDQLSVSGALSIANSYSGKDTDCRYSGRVPPHKDVVPDELAAANLTADPPALVTIQVGANDIDFPGCLGFLLGVPTFANTGDTPSDNCVHGDSPTNYQPSNRVQAELASLQNGLIDIITTIHRRAPHAQIVLVNYYQIAPQPDADLAGSSFICHDIRASAKRSRFRQQLRGKADFLQHLLNSTIQGVASFKGYRDVALVDIQRMFAGHELCTPQTWLFDRTWDAGHPTAEGQRQIAMAVLDKCSTLPKRCIGR